MKKYEKILKALANSRRLEIIRYLKINKKSTVGGLADGIKLSFRSTSKHLSILSSVGILENQHKGSFFVYTLSSNLDPLVKAVIQFV